MDANLFRLPTSPNFYATDQQSIPYVKRGTASAPAPDNRFPGWAGPIQDGRLVTDYRPHCETNIPSKMQEKSRIWIQRNSEDIIRVSRERTAGITGMKYGVDMSMVPDPTSYVHCTAAGCEFSPGVAGGIGVERKESVPYLFGTLEPLGYERQFTHVQQTTTQAEGGRNTRRG
jgi:hypothetical protein